MILVYTHKITSRLNYVFRHIFNNILQKEVKFTTKIEEFIAYNGPKFSYSPKALGNEFHITPHGLLFQQGTKHQHIQFSFWKDIPVFFQVEDSDIPFDIFSASFFLISRYEEYLPSRRDKHERYFHKDSVLSLQGLLNQPIIEIWVNAFKLSLNERFPGIEFKKRAFYFEPLINVSMARLYKHKAILRNVFGGLRDLFQLKLKLFWLRQKVFIGRKKDPYDTFDYILQLKKKYKHPLTFFHLLTPYSQFDHNISRNNKVYQTQLKYLADYASVGILTSYYSMEDEEMIVNEVKFLEKIIHKPIEKVRAHFNRIKIPETYQHYLEAGLSKDYSMGYNAKIGFRAGTSIPFYFYDIENESQTSLLVHPTIVSDIMLRYLYKLKPEKALEIIIEQGEQIRKYGGNFHPVFHNFILADLPFWKDWNNVYVETIKYFTKNNYEQNTQ